MTFIQKHAYDIGCGFAAALWPLFPSRQRVAIENILLCGITSDKDEAKRIAKKSWCHFVGHIVEALFVPSVINKDNWREHLDVSQAPEESVKLLLDTPDTPILILSAHHGTWEPATNLLSFARPMIAVARTMNNKLLAKWMKNHHFRGPVTIIDKNNGFKASYIEQWKRECAAMTILIDQYQWNGPMLKFLGRPARCITSGTRLAMRSGLPVIVGTFVRIAPYQYRLVGGTPVVFNKDSDRDEATQLLNDRLSEAIRQYPEQYLWAHRRWKDD